MKNRPNPFLRSAAFAASIFVGLAATAHAQANYFWDANGATTTATGGAGNWSTANTWRDVSATGTLGNWLDGSIANFGGTAGAVTITSGVTITTPRINVTANNYSISGGTVAFGGSSANPGIIDLTTSGTLAFASNATGSLRVLSTGSTANLTTASAMLINGSTNLTSFELALAGDGNSITINNAAALGSSSSTVKLTKGVLYLGNNAAPNNDVAISYNAWATDLAGGTIRARFNASTWNGATSLSANSMFMVRGGATVSLIFSSTGTINLNANTLSINANSTSAGVDLQGIVSGTGNITLVNTALGGSENGQGITKLSAANTFSGTATTTQNLGTLALNNTNALQNATLDTGLSGTQAVTFTVSGTNSYNIGALTGSDALAIGTNTISLGNKAGTSSFGADISGGGGLTKTGSSSTQTLTAATSYTGATQVTGGTLSLTGSGAINSSSGIAINGSGAKLLHTASSAISPIVTLTHGTLTGTGTVNTVNVGAGTGGIISNNDGVAGSALTIGNLTLAGAANINLFSNSISAPLVVTSALTTGATAATITANSVSGWTNGNTYNLINYGSLAGSGNNFNQTVNNLSARQNATWGNTGSAIQITINGDNPRWVGDTNGNWNLATTNNWRLVSGGGYTTFLATDDVLFDDNATGTRSIDINSANVAANSTVFNNTTSAAYTLGSSGGFGISAGNLTKNNTGTVTISSANTYAGPTTINGGSIILSGAGTLGTGSALTLGGGALDLGGLSRTVGAVAITSSAASGDTIGNGSLTGTSYAASNASGNAIISANLLVNSAAGFTKSGAGTVTLSGANTYTGTTAINGGSVVMGGSGTLGNGAALTLGGGSLNLGTLSQTVGAVSITSAAPSGDTISNGSLTGTSYAASNISGEAIISANLLVNGSAGFTKSGAGTTTLSGANTYTGATAISAGTLKAGSATVFSGLGALSMTTSGVLNLAGYNASFTNLTSASTNTITTTGEGFGTDVITVSALGSDTGASALFTDNGTRKLQISLTSGGAGSWQATSNINNTYSGGLVLGGSMRALVLGGTVGGPGAITTGQFGKGSVTVNGNSQIWFNASNRTLVNDVIVNGNAGNGSREGTFRIGTNSTALTGLVISGNVNANSTDAVFGSDSTSNGTALLLSGKLTGTSGFRFFQSSNAFTWTTTLNNATGSANDYSGATTINSAQTTLALGAANQIPNGAGKGNVILTSGFLDLAGFDETINGLSGGGTVNNVASGTANTLTLGDGDATNQTFSGAIQNSFGTLSLTKTGAGTQTFSGTNTYSGTTTISGGTLLVTGSHAGAAGAISIGAAGTLQIGNGAGTGVLSTTSTITNSGTLAFNRTGTVTQGTDFAAGITGSGALTTNGGGTLILSGTNGYTGTTTISNGELRLASAGAINGTSGITVNSGRLSLDGGITAGSGKSVTVNGNGGNFFGAIQGNSGTNEWAGNVAVGSTAGTRIGVNAGQLTVSGIISGSNSTNGLMLRPNNGTTLVISGANTYAGDTTIISGTGSVKLDGGNDRLPTETKLVMGVGGASPVSGILDLNGRSQQIAGLSIAGGTANEIKSATAATLAVNTAAASPSTFAGIITGSTALTKTGAETLTLTNTNTYTGATTITTGTLALTGTGSIANSANLIVNSTLDVSGITAGTFAIGSAQTLSGDGTINATGKTLSIAGTHAVGSSPGLQDITGNVSYTSTSIFEWDLAANVNGGTGTRGTDFDAVEITGDLTIASDATFKVIMNTGVDFTDTFWTTNQTFSNLWNLSGTLTSGWADKAVSIYNTSNVLQDFSANGAFTLTGSTLTWSAVPEPTSALAGLLIGAGLLRRRRTVQP